MLTSRFTLVPRGALILGAALCGLMVAPRAAAQAAPPARSTDAPRTTTGPVTPRVEDVLARSGDAEGEIDPEDVPAVRQLLDDEAQHRSRLARIHRLRDLATQEHQRERLAQLDDLERREMDHHAARRMLSQGQMSDRSFRTAEGMRSRGGVFHVQRREAAASSTPQRPPHAPGRSTTPSRPAPPPPVRPASQPPVRSAPRTGSPR
jgi:hypothetical protein